MEEKVCKCVCEDLPKLPCDMTVTMAYVPFQTELLTYTCAEALNNGTLFPELDKVGV